MSALARGNDAALVELPRAVWSQGSRPLQGRVTRWAFAGVIVSFGFVFANIGIRVGAVVAAAAFFFGLFPIVDGHLESLAKKFGSASKGEAGSLIEGLEERWVVSRFAPHVWVSAQKARLNMIKGDTRAAAHAFAEAARQSGNLEQPDLVGSQAHALVLSGDPKGARQLLVGMEERKQLRALDAFNLGVAYVEEPGKTDRAVSLLQRARKELGAAPRTDAALALAHARDNNLTEATSLLDGLDEDTFDEDTTAKELHKRARRSVRQATESRKAAKPKRKRAAEKTETAKPKRGKSKRDRRKERREKRKSRGDKGKASADVKPTDAEETAKVEAKAEADAKAEAEAEAKAKAEAEAKAAAEAKAEADAKAEAEAKAAAEAKAEAEAKAAAEAKAEAEADAKAAQEAEERELRAKAVAEALARSADDDEAAARKAKEEAAAAARAAADRALEKAQAKATEGAAPEKPLFGSDSAPLFVPPPVPAFGSKTSKPVAPSVPNAPKVAAPKVAAPPVVDAPAKPAIDTDGWDDLFGDD